MSDPYNLDRFVDAQAPVYAQVQSELAEGKKRGHWMWFIFPQIAGLGLSDMAKQYAISNKEEAYAYIDHAVLGPRLIECAQLVCAVEGKTITEILGPPDDLKFRSSMTLFRHVSDDPVFALALHRFFHDVEDARTVDLLKGGAWPEGVV